jgi:transketolase
MGDGELAEGSNWEAAAAASHHKLDNLVVFIDRNKLQISGRTVDVMSYEPLDKRWDAFGWGVRVIDGNDLQHIFENAAATHIGPVYIKIGSPKMPVLMDENYPFQIGKGIVMEDGSDITIIATGTLLSKAVAATKVLQNKGIHPRLINMHTIKPLDSELVLKAAEENDRCGRSVCGCRTLRRAVGSLGAAG